MRGQVFLLTVSTLASNTAALFANLAGKLMSIVHSFLIFVVNGIVAPGVCGKSSYIVPAGIGGLPVNTCIYESESMTAV